jgi:trk system potassium uptake protein TrkA
MAVLIVGSGEEVYHLAKSLEAGGEHVTVICDDDESCARLARRLKATVIRGDGSVPRVLEEAGVGDAHMVLALTPQDAANLVICQLAMLRHGVPRALALANDPDSEDVFGALGVATALAPSKILTAVIQSRAQLDAVRNVYPALGGKLNLTEVTLAAEAPAAGRAVQDLDLPPGALIGALFRGESALVVRGRTVLEAGDRLLLLSTPQEHSAAVRTLVGSS